MDRTAIILETVKGLAISEANRITASAIQAMTDADYLPKRRYMIAVEITITEAPMVEMAKELPKSVN